MDKIILVNENDEEIGIEEKLKVHKEGILHRAFSIFIFNDKQQLLIQKRAKTKYHSSGLWSNTCCSHPRANEILINAARRRLVEEMGFDCELKEIYKFIYKTNIDQLIEYEYDHILIGNYNFSPMINNKEVEDWKWINVRSLKRDIKNCPDKYTYWFKVLLNKIKF